MTQTIPDVTIDETIAYKRVSHHSPRRLPGWPLFWGKNQGLFKDFHANSYFLGNLLFRSLLATTNNI